MDRGGCAPAPLSVTRMTEPEQPGAGQSKSPPINGLHCAGFGELFTHWKSQWHPAHEYRSEATPRNPFKRRLAAGKSVPGMLVTMPNTHLAQILAMVGPDWLMTGMEHGPIAYLPLTP